MQSFKKILLRYLAITAIGISASVLQDTQALLSSANICLLQSPKTFLRSSILRKEELSPSNLKNSTLSLPISPTLAKSSID